MIDENGEGFHKNISTMEKRYAAKLSQNILSDYCWNQIEELSIASYKRVAEKSFKHDLNIYFQIFVV